MGVIIDSLVPNTACLEEPVPNPLYDKENSAGVLNKTKRVDPCVIKAHIHIPENNSVQELQFQRRDTGFVLPASLNNPTILGLVQRFKFDPQKSELQGTLFQSISFSRYWKNMYEAWPKEKRAFALSMPVIQQITDYVNLGVVESEDPIQQQKQQQLWLNVYSLTAPQEEFVLFVLNQLAEKSHDRMTPEVMKRVETLAKAVQFNQKIKKELSTIKMNEDQKKQLAQFMGDVWSYLLMGSPEFVKLTQGFRSLAEELYRNTSQTDLLDFSNKEAIKAPENIYQIFLRSLENLKMQASTTLFARQQMLKRWLENGDRSVELAYSVLSPRKAMELYWSEELKRNENVEQMVSSVKSWLRAHQFDAQWLGSEDRIPEILKALVPYIAFDRDPKNPEQLILNSEVIKKMPEGIEALLEKHEVQQREYVAAVYAVLAYLFGDPPRAERRLQLMYEGEIKNYQLRFNPVAIFEINSLYSSLKRRLAASYSNTEVVLPVVEALICAGGIGVTAWGLATMNKNHEVNDPITIGSSVSGLGCGALITHYAYPTRNPYLSDSVGGLILSAITSGTVLGIRYGLQKGEKRPAGWTAQIDIPPVSETKPKPEDKNPTSEYGP